MTNWAEPAITSLLGAAFGLAGDDAHASGHAAHVIPGAVSGASAILLVPIVTILATIICGLLAAMGNKSKLPAWISVGSLAICFGAVLSVYLGFDGVPKIAHGFQWINFSWGPEGKPGQSLVANFSFYVDTLTLLWMLFVTGLAAIIALYASEYMSHDVGLGYCRFFAAFNLFVFSMACLVMGDNLLLTFLGWEGVGLCSYLLIGYFYQRKEAVAAAKKAFIINRIGDLGFILGIMSVFVAFGTLELAPLFEMIQKGVDAGGNPIAGTWIVEVIPFLFAIGAFGKSAQIFFYVWLPDAMEGPTPVSALIHAATMVTAGVYLIARMYPLFAADEAKMALTFVAWSGAITAFWAATIEMAIFDIKRVMGYSTISQLGFMFAGLGLLTPQGAAYHTFTHAFFKATLFLGVGAVMHGFGGQLDLRRLSGVMWMRGFGLVGIAMLIGSMNLTGIPGTAGFFSKDMILAQGFSTPDSMIGGAYWLGWLLLLTAGMTAYYTGRTFFRVYLGPKDFTPGNDAELIDLGRHPKGTTLEEWHAQHGHGHGHGGHGHDSHGDVHGHAHGHAHGHSAADHRTVAKLDFDPTTEEFDPHPPGMAMKAAIAIAMVLSVLAAIPYFMGPHGGWAAEMVNKSSASFHGPETFNFLGITSHKAMYLISAVVGLIGLAIAAYLHGPKGWQGLYLGNRESAGVAPRADKLVGAFGALTKAARSKYYVDEIYDALIRTPLKVLANIFYLVDQFIVDGVVNAIGAIPKFLGKTIRPMQSGELHGYALGMAGGLAVLVLIVVLAAS
jgi:NADH-quinone oxidoreductase subunit L